MAPGEYVPSVQEKENADRNDPNGAAQSAEEAVAVGGGTVSGEARASLCHLANKEPDAKTDQNDWNNAMNGEAMKEARISDEKETAKSDEPDGSRGKTVTRRGYEIGVGGIRRCTVGGNRGHG